MRTAIHKTLGTGQACLTQPIRFEFGNCVADIGPRGCGRNVLALVNRARVARLDDDIHPVVLLPAPAEETRRVALGDEQFIAEALEPCA